jgi:predicted transcriptional regulator
MTGVYRTPEGRPLSSVELKLSNPETLRVAQALASETCVRILKLISETKLDVSTIAERLQLSESYVSKELHLLEDLKIIKASYATGKRGIRKICELAVEKVTIRIKE